jgi:hypothetical protein
LPALLLAWASLGHLALLAVSALFPRYVFFILSDSPFYGVLGLSIAGFAMRDGDVAEARARIFAAMSRVSRRRHLAGLAAGLVLLASAAVSAIWPAGVHAAIVHSDGTREEIGRRADFDLCQAELLALATHVGASVQMHGYFLPGWAVPWSREVPSEVTRWEVTGKGSVRLELNPYNLIAFDNGDATHDGVVKLADLSAHGGPIGLLFEPRGTWGNGLLEVALGDQSLGWRLFARPTSLGQFWLISVQRLLLAVLLVLAVPLLLALVWGAFERGALRLERVAGRLPLGREAALVGIGAAVFIATVAPRVQPSAIGDQAAFLNWADYLERGPLVQPPARWVSRWRAANPQIHHALAMHVPLATDLADPAGPRLVNGKPIGLSLLIRLAQGLGGEVSGYYVSLLMSTATAVAAYTAARVSGLGVILALAGSASLVHSVQFLHNAIVLDPDAAAAGWIAVTFVGSLLSHRSGAWSAVAGASLGMACLTRHNAAIGIVLVVPFLLIAPRRIVPFALGAAPFAGFLLLLHWKVYGHPLQFPYSDWATQTMAWSGPFLVELLQFLRAFVDDLSPVVWVPFVAYPFLGSRPRAERLAVVGFVVAWVGLLALFPKIDPWFLRYLLPIYPMIVFGALHSWNYIANLKPRITLGLVTVCTGLWIGTRSEQGKGPPPPDSIRVAAAWVDYYVPPDGALLTNYIFNNAIYYYTGRRQFPLTFALPRPPGVDLLSLRSAAMAASDTGEWCVLLATDEIEAFSRSYPELELEELRRASDWRLFRVGAMGSVP